MWRSNWSSGIKWRVWNVWSEKKNGAWFYTIPSDRRNCEIPKPPIELDN